MADPSTIFASVGIVAWHRSDTFGNSGGLLTSVPDQSGNGRDWTVNGAPTYSATGHSATVPSATFNGTADYLSSTAIGPLMTGGNNNTCYAAQVFKRISSIASGECFLNIGSRVADGNAFARFVAGNSATQWEVRWRNSGSGAGLGGVGGTVDANWHLAEIVRTASTLDLLIDGVSVIGGPQSVSVDMGTIDRASIAALVRNTVGAFANMGFVEDVLLDGVPTAAERLAYAEYVAQRYDVLSVLVTTGVVGDAAIDGDPINVDVFAATGVSGDAAIDGDAWTADLDLSATGTVGTLSRPATKDGGVGSSTLLGDLGVTTSVVEHYTTTRLAQDPAFTFVNLGENNYTTWHLLPTGSPAPPTVPVGTLASPDEARNVTALIAAGVTRAVVNVNSDIFRLANNHGITAEQDLKDFFDAYILPNYWTIYTALEDAGITTIVCAIQPRDTTGGTAATRATEAYAYTKLAAMFGARFVGGFYTYLVDVDGTMVDALTDDTTHPNDAATPTLAGYWVAAFDAIDAPGANFGDAGSDVDLGATGTVGDAAIDGDAVSTGTIGATGVEGVGAIDGHESLEGDLACTGTVGDAAIDGDAWTDECDLACTGVAGDAAIDGDPLTAGALAATGTVGTAAMDADVIPVAVLACTGTVGTCSIVSLPEVAFATARLHVHVRPVVASRLRFSLP